MADDDNNTDQTETADAKAASQTPPVKKTRAPRQKKATAVAQDVGSEAVTSPVDAVRSGRGRGRKAKPVPTTADAAAKVARRTRAPKAVVQPEAAPVEVLDELEDLIKLEEENQRLRKLLAEKLRSENADLRKKLDRLK
ncbi:transcriptional regulator (plasmid) [Rhizobium bangladeshense]|uniref:transcriptional regulator n=1 Tax=Rhizobium bangladeshense TaxID=1138189 RepID=UPI001A99706B|nr:transcriptional regulator [Rhizobium bangladeshense]QSY97961.1 transcriptional regulator [Rhizobium bangladeshense]